MKNQEEEQGKKKKAKGSIPTSQRRKRMSTLPHRYNRNITKAKYLERRFAKNHPDLTGRIKSHSDCLVKAEQERDRYLDILYKRVSK